MTQRWDDASLGPHFLFAGCRNIPPKSWLGNDLPHGRESPFSLRSTDTTSHCKGPQKKLEAICFHCFGWYLVISHLAGVSQVV